MGSTAAKLQAALDSKNAIKDSLENKGLSPSNKFSEYAGLIDELENTSDATATAATIFEGEVAYTAEGRTVGTATPGIPIVNTAGTGAAYTATVPNMDALTVGKTITIIPHTTSTSANATLNVNGLGAKYIRQRLSTNTGATAAGYTDGWILANKPLTLMYNGTYWVSEITRPDANTIYGTTKIENGGTGASTADGARANLGALGKSDVVDNLESTATDLPASANSVRLVNEKVNELNSNIESFQNGVDSIVQACTDNGSTPESNTPNGIISAINAISNSGAKFIEPVLKNSASWNDSTRTISYTATEDDKGYFLAFGYAYTVTCSTDGTMIGNMGQAAIAKLEAGQSITITGSYGSAYSKIYKIA